MFLVITIITFLIGAVLCLVKGKTFDHCRPEILRKLLRVLSNSELNGYLVNTMVAFWVSRWRLRSQTSIP